MQGCKREGFRDLPRATPSPHSCLQHPPPAARSCLPPFCADPSKRMHTCKGTRTRWPPAVSAGASASAAPSPLRQSQGGKEAWVFAWRPRPPRAVARRLATRPSHRRGRCICNAFAFICFTIYFSNLFGAHERAKMQFRSPFAKDLRLHKKYIYIFKCGLELGLVQTLLPNRRPSPIQGFARVLGHQCP